MEPFRPGEPAYAGVGVTYCRTPLVLDPADLAGADAVVLGAPFDEGVSHRPGARFGPRAIRAAEHDAGPSARPSMELGIDPLAELTVVDHGDIEAVPAGLDISHARLREAVAGIIAAGAVPVVLGGDHSLSAPVMQALAETHGPEGYSVIHFDTHADTGADLEGIVNWHGTPFYRGVTEGFMAGANIVQVGLRGAWPPPEIFDWMREQGFRWHTMDEIVDRGIGRVIDDAIAHAAARAPRTYLTVDVDVLDPAFAPGTGTPEPGGLQTRELLRAVRRIATEVDLCAMDVVEVSPPYDHAEVTAMAAHRVVLNALGGLALRRAGRPPRPQRS